MPVLTRTHDKNKQHKAVVKKMKNLLFYFTKNRRLKIHVTMINNDQVNVITGTKIHDTL